MNILFLGPQGSGKGTQARLLAEKYDFCYFEAGDFLRKLSQENDHVKKIIDSGELVPEKEMASYVKSFFDEKQIYDQILFDGFPRTLGQYKSVKVWMKEKNINFDIVFVLNISEDASIERISNRRIDKVTGKIYNLLTDLPPANIAKERLIQREDDKPKAIKKRLNLYKKMTMPLINELKKDANVFEINAEKSVNEIQDDLERIINDKSNN